jgi:hypothetical protein
MLKDCKKGLAALSPTRVISSTRNRNKQDNKQAN